MTQKIKKENRSVCAMNIRITPTDHKRIKAVLEHLNLPLNTWAYTWFKRGLKAEEARIADDARNIPQ